MEWNCIVKIWLYYGIIQQIPIVRIKDYKQKCSTCMDKNIDWDMIIAKHVQTCFFKFDPTCKNSPSGAERSRFPFGYILYKSNYS